MKRHLLHILIVPTLGMLAGCATLDRQPHTIYFEPMENGFKYAVKSNIIFPEADPEAEEVRMQWINSFLEENDLCAHGYKIVERKVNRGETVIGAEAGQIFYTGECT